MKKFDVSEKCNACGMCLITSDWFIQDENGFALPDKSKYIHDNKIERAEEIVNMCPMNAISMIEQPTRSLNELSKVLEERLNEIGKVEVDYSDFAFYASTYNLEPMDTNIGSDYKYSSESKAASAGINYLDAQIDIKIYEMLSKYKYEMFTPFYEQDGEYYAEHNKKIEQVLREIYAEAQAATQNSINLPEDFIKFEAQPSEWSCTQLRTFERGGDCKTGWSLIERIRSKRENYTKWTSDYAAYIDCDCYEEYVGEGFFGSKYKRMYNCDIEDCEKTMRSDYELAIMDLSDTIEYAACQDLECCINDYNDNIEELIQEKIRQFRQACELGDRFDKTATDKTAPIPNVVNSAIQNIFASTINKVTNAGIPENNDEYIDE